MSIIVISIIVMFVIVNIYDTVYVIPIPMTMLLLIIMYMWVILILVTDDDYFVFAVDAHSTLILASTYICQPDHHPSLHPN